MHIPAPTCVTREGRGKNEERDASTGLLAALLHAFGTFTAATEAATPWFSHVACGGRRGTRGEGGGGSTPLTTPVRGHSLVLGVTGLHMWRRLQAGVLGARNLNLEIFKPVYSRESVSGMIRGRVSVSKSRAMPRRYYCTNPQV